MKKIFSLIIVLIMLFSAVGCAESTSESSIDSVSSISDLLSVNKNLLESNSEKGNTYNSAINEFNKFLSGEISAITSNGEIKITDFTRLSDGLPGIDRYTLSENNDNGIPLLHIQALEHSVLSFDGNNIALIYTSPVTRTEGTITLLKDGTVFSKVSTMGTQYHFASFINGNDVTTVDFFSPDRDDEGIGYSFNGTIMPKEEWQKRTQPFFKLAQETATVEWFDYK